MKRLRDTEELDSLPVDLPHVILQLIESFRSQAICPACKVLVPKAIGCLYCIGKLACNKYPEYTLTSDASVELCLPHFTVPSNKWRCEQWTSDINDAEVWEEIQRNKAEIITNCHPERSYYFTLKIGWKLLLRFSGKWYLQLTNEHGENIAVDVDHVDSEDSEDSDVSSDPEDISIEDDSEDQSTFGTSDTSDEE